MHTTSLQKFIVVIYYHHYTLPTTTDSTALRKANGCNKAVTITLLNIHQRTQLGERAKVEDTCTAHWAARQQKTCHSFRQTRTTHSIPYISLRISSAGPTASCRACPSQTDWSPPACLGRTDSPARSVPSFPVSDSWSGHGGCRWKTLTSHSRGQRKSAKHLRSLH